MPRPGKSARPGETGNGSWPRTSVKARPPGRTVTLRRVPVQLRQWAPSLEQPAPVPLGSAAGRITGRVDGVTMPAKPPGPTRPTFTDQEALQFHSRGRP